MSRNANKLEDLLSAPKENEFERLELIFRFSIDWFRYHCALLKVPNSL